MSLPRVRLESSVRESDTTWILDPREGHHLLSVRRCRDGDLFEGLLPGRKILMRLDLSSGEARGVVISESPEGSGREIWLLAGLLKGDPFDRLVAQSVETGVSVLVPLLCSRSVVSIPPGKITSRMERWRRIAMEATKQCGRADPPEILEPVPLSSIPYLQLPSHRFVTVTGPAQAILASRPHSRAAVAVGPEGDWTEEELVILEREGFCRVSLGPGVMRSHTAGIVAVAVLSMMLDGDVHV
ncbi:MAG: RsmE family RNA methyltransferase [Thermovirgaceae bacterium]|nr:RsmE family RNA methyltransferase [Synergistales bacterium]MDI9392903.1 RsmE family RNA methyltransferase [Synergistota bacterium]NLV65429.1 16S rRNA (uracil(1498)-N(3))-methyltransferase [Synergistaceae bacterium]HRW88255.1 RsmE family RNA methyltransferase [Thermovirgaceae bacterium]MDD3133289.1 RsmE family RNA methyltransferase [Synergistales bacterium]